MRETTVILTRDPDNDLVLSALLQQRGARVIAIPCVRTGPLIDPAPLVAAIAALGSDDVLAVTSRQGADAIVRGGAAATAAVVAAVGGATAERLRPHGIIAGFVPSRADGAALARELPLPRGHVLLARSDRARIDVVAILRDRGADVREVVAYRTIAEAQGDVAGARRAIAAGATVVVASPSAVDALREAVGTEALRSASFVAIGPTTGAHATALGLRVRIAGRPDPDALMSAVLAALETLS